MWKIAQFFLCFSESPNFIASKSEKYLMKQTKSWYIHYEFGIKVHIMKATVSGVFEDLKLEISEGYKQN